MRLAASGDDERAGVDADDLVAGGGVEDDRRPSGGARLDRRGSSARPRADDDDVAVLVQRGPAVSVPRWRRRRCVVTLALDRGSAPRRRLAGADVGDAVDDGEAVLAVAAEAQRAAETRLVTCPQHRDGERVACLELDGLAVERELPVGAAQSRPMALRRRARSR